MADAECGESAIPHPSRSTPHPECLFSTLPDRWHNESILDQRFIRNFAVIAHIDHGKSTLADRFLEPDLCWLAELKLGIDGFDLEGMKSMQTGRARSAFDTLQFPPQVRIFAYVAVPLSGSISERGSGGYARMRELGPNDGLTLLADELIPQATPLLAPGADHFLDPVEQELWSTALFRVFAAEAAAR